MDGYIIAKRRDLTNIGASRCIATYNAVTGEVYK